MIETLKVEHLQQLVEDIEAGFELDVWMNAANNSEESEELEQFQHTIQKAQTILTLLTFGTVNIDGNVQANEFARNIQLICSTAISDAKDKSLQAEKADDKDAFLKYSGAIAAYQELSKAISIKFH